MIVLFSKEKINKILTQNDIVKVIGSKIRIFQSGTNYKAQCPFHEEKTPSFFINRSKQFYYCFGCGSHGNSINFLMKYSKISFIDSISYLARGVNLDLSSFIKFEGESNNRIYSTMNQCLDIYSSKLEISNEARIYLKKRSISTDSIRKFGIGYSPKLWNNLNSNCDRTRELSLIKTGMQIKKNGKVYDRFRNRIMFPVKNYAGKVVGFGGRSIDNAQPKYINSPETRIFHKSNELYGLYELESCSLPLRRLLIVEGYIDVVTLFQHGIQSVAVLGTAINIKQIKKCLKYTRELIFCFDGDSPGRRAAWKTMKVILSILGAGVTIKFLFLPDGTDPDGLINKVGKDRFEKYIDNSSVFTEIFFDIIKKKFSFSSLESKIRYANTVMQYIKQAPRGFAQEIMKKELGNRLQLHATSVDIACSSSKNLAVMDSGSKEININFSERLIYLLANQSNIGSRLYGWRFLLFTDIGNISTISSLLFCSSFKDGVKNLMLSTVRKLEKVSLVRIKEKVQSTKFKANYLELVHLFKIVKTCFVKQKTAELLMKVKENIIGPDEIIVLQMILTKIQNL